MINLYKIGLVTAFIHALIIMYIFFSVDYNSQIWLWMMFDVIDFPVSELRPVSLDILISLWGEPPFDLEWKMFVYRNITAFIYLIFGSIWWFFIPVIIGWFFNLFDREKKKK